MAGILESLFDGGGWQQLLGIGSANAMSAPPPPPPPQVMQQAPQSFSPNSTFDAGNTGQPLSFADRAAPVQEGIASGAMDPEGRNFTDFGPGATPGPNPGITRASYQPEEPPPQVRGGPQAGPRPQPQGGPPMPPPMAPGAGPPTSSPGGGLMSALGLTTPEARQSALAGVGRGLTAVSKMRSGAPRGAMIAAGLGGGIEGQQGKEREQTEDILKAKKEAFTENLQTKNYDLNKLNAAIRQRQMEMQIPWWQARADVLKAQQGQSASSKAWQMSDPGKYHLVDTEVQKHQQGLIQLYREEIKQAALEGNEERAGKIRDLIKKETEEFRAEKYKLYNLDPGKRDQAIKRGFEGSEDDIRYLAPGTRFWDAKAGKTRIRGSDKDNAPIGADRAAAAQPSIYEQAGPPAETE